MIDASVLVDNLVAMLRDIPALVTLVGAAPKIFAYHDSFPQNVSTVHALHQMPAPAILVFWEGTGPGGFGGMDVWKHRLKLYIRAKEELSVGSWYYQVHRQIVKGIPTAGGGIEMINQTVHASCYPMELPAIQRQTDAEALDYFEMAIDFPEIGDS